MPISVVDSIHILSEFFDRYNPQKGRKGTIVEVMKTLYTPMLYTSLTSAAGFASLALTPIPPVQIFGIFVAVGIMIAWLWTVVFVPAYTMMINESRLKNFGLAAVSEEKQTWLTKLLFKIGSFTYRQAKLIIAAMVVVSTVAVYGITQIQINDNPVKWFAKSHPIRQADIELNKHFGGTYMAYLVLDDAQNRTVSKSFAEQICKKLAETAATMEPNMPGFIKIAKGVGKTILEKVSTVKTQDQLLDTFSKFATEQAEKTKGSESDIWYEIASFFDLQKENLKIFKQPDVLNYIVQLQDYLKQSSLVGKSSSVADVVRKVYQELTNGKPENYVVPNSSSAVAQCLLQFQSSHKPEDLWHLVTYDYMHANIWLQLKSGDNKDMEAVVKTVKQFFDTHKPPVPLNYSWAGLTYINTVWQDKMVWGMLQSFLGSFIIVFIMMAVLFRSILWGLVCMIPLTVTIAMIYGIIGLVGKDYDMPVAVLSALTLGMAVDFAIHFLERARESYRQVGSWEKAAPMMFGEPARAISRNVLVIAIGFLPLLAAPLVPYKTVGIFVCAIMGLSGIVTLLVLPAILRIGEKTLFKSLKEPVSPSCNCVFCLVISIAATVLVAINLHQNWNLGLSKLTWFSIIAIALMTLVCGVMSRRKACRNLTEKKEREV
jgi:predicted RND superfamily exporter protein